MQRYSACCIALVSLLGCKSAGKPAELPPAAAPSVDSAPLEAAAPPAAATPPPAAAAAQQAPAPPPDFDGNWFVLEPGQTVEQFAQALGLPEETLRTRAREVDFHWLSQLERDIGQRFPQIKEAWGGQLSLPRAGYSDRVAEGEDLWKLVERFKTSAVELLVVNGLGPDDAGKIAPGMRIVVPGIVRKLDGKMIRLPHPKEAAALVRAKELNLGTVGTASKLLFGHMEDRWMEAAGGPKFLGTLNWPVAGGWYVRGFGSGEAGYHLAVDVAGPTGWPARASDSGVVAYAGDGIRGYGNIVMLIHPGGFVTFYAHLSATFVYSGEQVERGEIIGEVGSTGISKGPHVHYEFVHKGQNCNPEPLFRPGMKRHDGTELETEKLEWTESQPPKGLKCAPRPKHHPSSQWVDKEDATRDADKRSGLKPAQ
jgi:murein DD-endopeptidase MepM/ murein hydrolase activator NlpD